MACGGGRVAVSFPFGFSFLLLDPLDYNFFFEKSASMMDEFTSRHPPLPPISGKV